MQLIARKSWVVLALAASVFGSATTLRAEEAVAVRAPASARVEGVLVAKGANWIEVKADGSDSVVRFRPRWIGKLPKDGGGFDAAVLRSFSRLVVPNRVALTWENSEGPRVLWVEMILPTQKGGRLNGVVVAKGENWIDIRVGDTTERYSPRWIGGLPKHGGGLDREMLQRIAAAKVGSPVVFEWLYEERKRVAMLRAAM